MVQNLNDFLTVKGGCPVITNPLLQLQSFGQSIWLDLLRRSLITSGELQRYVDEDGLRGITSNPKIFHDAIDGSADYDDDIQLLAPMSSDMRGLYESLAVSDIQAASDVFRPVYERLDGRDGFVSLEVNPHLAHDTAGTVAEARRLWKWVDRPNVFIKIPATREGLPAIQRCLCEGININITLLFGLQRYRDVAHAFISAMEERAADGKPLARVESVASFFLSRIDVLLDPMLEKVALDGGERAATASELKGKVAIGSAKLAYQIYKEVFDTEQFRRLAEKGARTQRVLWASTSTKNPDYEDLMYVEPLIGPNTVNTVPLETLNAYRDHGHPEPRLEQGVQEAQQTLQSLKGLGIEIDAVTQQLEDEGVTKFIEPFDKLLASLENKQRSISVAVTGA
ncbi:MAG: transaldolase [Candidatus Hydrogenedentes bacterium]|nr:transaldolase [Candidatus Hydrogenedentota bacterium]